MTSLEYANARIKGLKSFLIKESDIRIAMELKNVRDFAVWLENTPYKNVLEGKGIEDIERALFREWVDTSEKIKGLVPDDTRDFFSAFVSVFEIEALKMMVASKTNGRTSDSYAVSFSGRLRTRSKKLAEAETVNAMAEVLGRTEYGQLFRKCIEEKKDINAELDMYYFTKLWHEFSRLSSSHRDSAEKLIGTDIDAVNVMKILRAKENGDNEVSVIEIFHRLRKQAVNDCKKTDSVKSALSILSSGAYGRLLDEASQRYEKDKSLFHFEQSLRRFALKLYRSAMMDVLGVGVPLSYLKLKETEIKNLRSIALGLDNGLGKNDIEEMLI